MLHLNQKKACKRIFFSFLSLTVFYSSCVLSTASSDNDLLSFQEGLSTKQRHNAKKQLIFQTQNGSNGISYQNIKNFSIQGKFSDDTTNLIAKSFEPLSQHHTIGHLHVSNENQIHLTVTTIKNSDDSFGISNQNIGRVLGRAAQHFLPQYEGRFYGLYMLVNGVDAAGRKVTAHYSSPATFTKALSSPVHQFNPNNGNKPLTAHFVLRFGTNPSHYIEHQTQLSVSTIHNIQKMDGALPRDIKAFQKEIKSKTNFRSAYDNVTTHITVASLKSKTGAVDPSWPALDLNHALNLFNKAYHIFSKGALRNHKATMTMESVKVEQVCAPRFLEIGKISSL